MDFPYSVAPDVPLFLAPMAGVSESPFRQICRRFGADVVVSEFISSVGISLGIERVLAVARGEAVACELSDGRRVERSRQRFRIVDRDQ